MTHMPDPTDAQNPELATEVAGPDATHKDLIPPLLQSESGGQPNLNPGQNAKRWGAVIGGSAGVLISILLLAKVWPSSSGTSSLRLLTYSVLIPFVISLIGMEFGGWLYHRRLRSDDVRRQDRLRDTLTIVGAICGGIGGLVFAFIFIDVQREFGEVSSLAIIIGTMMAGITGAFLGGALGYKLPN